MTDESLNDLDQSINSAVPIEIKYRPDVLSNLRSSSWIGDEVRTKELLIDLTALLIKLDTTTQTGEKLNEIPELLQDIFAPLGYGIKKGGTHSEGKYFLMFDSSRTLPYFAGRVDIPLAIHFHLDTEKFEGFSTNVPRIDSSKNIFGRGASDVKGLAASLILSLYTLKYTGAKLPYIMVTTDEEVGNAYSSGAFLSQLRIKRLIDLEPTSNAVGALLDEVLPNTVYNFGILNPTKLPSLKQIKNSLSDFFPGKIVNHVYFDKSKLSVTFEGIETFEYTDGFKAFTADLGLFYRSYTIAKGFKVKNSPLFEVAKQTLVKHFEPALHKIYPEMVSVVTTNNFDVGNRTFKLSGNFNCTYSMHFSEIDAVVSGISEAGLARHSRLEGISLNQQYLYTLYLVEFINSAMTMIEA